MAEKFVIGRKEDALVINSKEAIDCNGELLKGEQWYKVDREKRQFIPITKDEALDGAPSLWHERLYVTRTAGIAIRVAQSNEAGVPLVMYVHLNSVYGLYIDDEIGNRDEAHVAFLDKPDVETRRIAGAETVQRGTGKTLGAPAPVQPFVTPQEPSPRYVHRPVPRAHLDFGHGSREVDSRRRLLRMIEEKRELRNHRRNAE